MGCAGLRSWRRRNFALKVCRGICLPDWDEHFEGQIERGPLFEGRGTYQFPKVLRAIAATPSKRRRLAIDVGAHVGLWARVLASHFGRVIAFEPMSDIADCFDVNLAAATNVTLDRRALGDVAGMGRIKAMQPDIASGRIGAGGEMIRIVTLDEVDPQGVDLIKIDVEGYDLKVLLGGERVIRRDKPVVVIEQKGRSEAFGARRREGSELLEQWGARVVDEISGDVVMAWA